MEAIIGRAIRTCRIERARERKRKGRRDGWRTRTRTKTTTRRRRKGLERDGKEGKRVEGKGRGEVQASDRLNLIGEKYVTWYTVETKST